MSQADVSVAADITLQSGDTHAGLVARYSGTGDGSMYLGALVSRGGTTSGQIWRCVGGNWDLLAVAPVSGSSGTLKLDVVGSSLTLSFGGTVITGATDTTIAAAGQVGLRALGGSSFDNVLVQEAEDQTPAGLQVVSGAFTEQSNVLTAAGSGINLALSTETATSDADIQADVTVLTTGNSHAGLLARRQASGDMYLGALVGLEGNYSLQIWKCVGGAWSMLSAVSVVTNTGTLRFQVQGNSLSLSLDGSLLASVVDSDVVGAGQTRVSWQRRDLLRLGVGFAAFDADNRAAVPRQAPRPPSRGLSCAGRVRLASLVRVGKALSAFPGRFGLLLTLPLSMGLQGRASDTIADNGIQWSLSLELSTRFGGELLVSPLMNICSHIKMGRIRAFPVLARSFECPGYVRTHPKSRPSPCPPNSHFGIAFVRFSE